MSTPNSRNWQQVFVETNLLMIGFNAWNGYLKCDRGAVVCSTNSLSFIEVFQAKIDISVADRLDRLNRNFSFNGWRRINGINFLRFPSISLTANPLDPFGRIDPTQVYNLAGKHVNNGIVLSDNQFVQASWGTPFDLDVLTDSPDVVLGLVDLNNINFVRVVDIPENGSFLDSEGRPIYDPWPTPVAGSGGFDLEAISVINAATVPEPTSIFGLLLTGVLATRLRVGNHQKK